MMTTGAVIQNGLMGQALVFRDSERLFSKKLVEALPAGDYTLKVRFTSPELGYDLERQINFTKDAFQASAR